MGRLQLLDCTLREAPIDNLMWGDEHPQDDSWS